MDRKNRISTVQKKTLRDYMTVGFRRKWMFMVPCVLATALVVMGIYALPKKYCAIARALRTDQAALTAAMRGLKMGSERTSLSVIKQEILVPKQLANVLKRPEVLKVLDDPPVVKALSREWDKMGPQSERQALDELQDLLERLRKKIDISVVARSTATEIIWISVTDQDPVRARVLANAIGVTYVEYHRKVLEDAAIEAIKFPKALLEEAKAELQQVENDIEKFRTEKFSQLPEAKMTVLKRHAGLESEIPRMENNIAQTQKKLDAHKKLLAEQPRKVMHKISPSENLEVITLTDRIAQIEAGLTTMLLSVTENHPDVRTLRGELVNARNRLKQLESSSVRDAREIEVDNPLWEIMATEEKQIVDDLVAQKTELGSLISERDLLDKRIKKFSPEAYRYNDLLRNREASSKKYVRCRTMVEESQLRAYLEKEKQGTTVKVFSPALTPAKPSFPPSPMRVVAIALAMGVGAGIGFVLLGEMADHSFRTVEDASDYLETPILGTIGTITPAVPGGGVWLKRILFTMLVVILITGMVLSYIYQDPLREFVKTLLG